MFVKLYLIALPLFLAIDIFWLGIIAKNFYAKQIGFLMKTEINWLSAIVFYLLFLVGLVVFVISPAVSERSIFKALSLGLLFGLVTYATYDLTNLATIKNWPLLVTLVDLIWGMILSVLVSIISVIIANKLGL